ncbi:SPFH domain-containing protein [Sinosporangium siamense]|uniref:Band 7 domain-containing protein n=1 Tax=Sinosporangium siamense TaxID=1367973 RepID=A0A919V9H7_9ACTN|nr:SPFH domain-containing protein [Sinosporangium siamense]GII97230.1 hypothetical protein Ssi02_74610 [Sinosporangium siamense]
MFLTWLLAGLGAIAVLALIVVSRWWETPGPQTALIFPGGVVGRSGRDGEDLRVVVGKARLVLPPRRHKGEISLSERSAKVTVQCETQQMLRVGVHAVVSYRVGESREFIQRAALRYLKNPAGLAQAVEDIISSEVRSVIGNIDFEVLVSDQTSVIEHMREQLEHDFNLRGLVVDKVGITRIDDHDGHAEELRRATEIDAKLRREKAERSYEVEVEQAMADAAEKKYALRQRSETQERELARSDADKQRFKEQLEAERKRAQAEFEAVLRQQRAESELKHAELERQLAAKRAERDDIVERKRIELKAWEADQINAAEVRKTRQLNELEVARLLQSAQAKGIELQGKIAAMDPAKAEQYVLLTLAENLPEIAKAAKVELPNLQHVIQSAGGETNSVLSTLTQVGLPIMEMVRTILGNGGVSAMPSLGLASALVPPAVTAGQQPGPPQSARGEGDAGSTGDA